MAKSKQEIAEYIKQRPELSNYEVAKNMRRHGVRAADVAEARGECSKVESAAASPRVRVRSLTEFKRDHDIPQKIRDRLRGMRRDGYVSEEELRQLCEVPVQNWRRHAELPEFSPHKLKIDGVTYWASVETIKQMKQITGRA